MRGSLVSKLAGAVARNVLDAPEYETPRTLRATFRAQGQPARGRGLGRAPGARRGLHDDLGATARADRTNGAGAANVVSGMRPLDRGFEDILVPG